MKCISMGFSCGFATGSRRCATGTGAVFSVCAGVLMGLSANVGK